MCAFLSELHQSLFKITSNFASLSAQHIIRKYYMMYKGSSCKADKNKRTYKTIQQNLIECIII